MTAKDLKNALLQEAVQGKLVPQIASEGNARDLLEEICKEKTKLVKEGKIKKEKQTGEITEEEKPFEIPDNWSWTTIGNIAFVTKLAGFEYSSTIAPNLTTKGIPLFKGKNIQNSEVIYNFEGYIPEGISDELERSQITRKCLLTPYVGTIGNIGIHNREGKYHLGSNVGKIETYCPNLTLDEYLFYYLKSPQGYEELTKFKKATAQESISIDAIRQVYIPLPPLAEQQRIVDAIEKFMPLIEEYGKKETELKAFNEQIGILTKKAILQEAVQGKLVPQIAAEGNAKDLLEEIKKEKAKLIKEGKIKKEKPLPEITEDEIPFDIPESWCWCRLGEIVDTNIGLTYSPSDIIQNGGTEVLRSNNIQNGKIVYDNLVHVSKNVPEKCLSKKGDLLICARNGSKALVGKSALIEQDGMAFGAFMAIVRSPINPYILHFINSPVYRAKLDGVNTTTINQITQDNLRETVFPLPPLAEQKRIVNAIEKMLSLCEKIGE
jgi:type I restriction enzyme S subunit